MTTFAVYRASGHHTFDPTLFPAGTLTAPEGSKIEANKLVMLDGRWHTADSGIYAAGRGWDQLAWQATEEAR